MARKVLGVAPRWYLELQKELGGLELGKTGRAVERKSSGGGGGLLV